MLNPLVRASIASIALLPLLASAEGHIDVSLKVVSPHEPGATVLLTLTNTGDTPVSIMEWDTPFPAAGGRLPGAIFKVTDLNGKEVAYRGSWIYVGRLTMESFRSIAPGEVLSKKVNLAPEYRFEPNQAYEISYDINLTRHPDTDVVAAAEAASFIKPTQEHAVSNSVTVFFEDWISAATTRSADDKLKCTASEETSIASA